MRVLLLLLLLLLLFFLILLLLLLVGVSANGAETAPSYKDGLTKEGEIMFQHGLAAVFVFVLCSYEQTPERAADAAKIKWAKGIAADFWEAAIDGQFKAAEGLLSPEFITAIKGREQRNSLEGHLNWLTHFPNWEDVTYSPVSAEIAPDGSEVTCKGILTIKPTKAECTMRIAKEGSTGKWSIRYLHVRTPKEKAPEPKKP
jgi:hypothetical protein